MVGFGWREKGAEGDQGGRTTDDTATGLKCK